LKVPDSVKSKLDLDVVEMIESGRKPSRVGGDYVEKLALDSLSFKDRTRKILLEVYQSEGYLKFMEVVSKMKDMKSHEFNSMIQVKGEIAEVVLEVIVSQFVSEHGLDWKIFKGLILNYDGKAGSGSATTEIDLILVSPTVVSIFEIKSYNGSKVLSGDCVLTSDYGGYSVSKDVFFQNRKHIQAFWANFKNFALSETGIVKSVLFSFSKGSLRDDRTIDKVEVMPVYDEVTVSRYLEAIRVLNVSPRWEVGGLNAAIASAKEKAVCLEDHVAMLSGRHGGSGG
jgi:hypothetical protein